MTLEVVDLKMLPIAAWLEDAMAQHPYRPLWWLPGVSEQSQRALLERTLQAALGDPQHSLLGLFASGRIVGIADLRFMLWDTNHFGFPVYRMDNWAVWGDKQDLAPRSAALLVRAVDAARALGAVTLHTWLSMDAIRSIQAFESAGFRTMDILVTWAFEHTRQRISDYEDRCTIRGYQPGDEAVFIPLAREAYTEIPDRFHADPHLSVERSNELYAEWIKNSCSGQLADHVIVAELNGRPAGYTTLRLEGDHEGLSNVRTGGLILSAVAPWAEGRGLYTSMINGGLKWFGERGVEVSHLGTQVNNYPVQRAWARLGFRLVKSGPSMHLWLEEARCPA